MHILIVCLQQPTRLLSLSVESKDFDYKSSFNAVGFCSPLVLLFVWFCGKVVFFIYKNTLVLVINNFADVVPLVMTSRAVGDFHHGLN